MLAAAAVLSVPVPAAAQRQPAPPAQNAAPAPAAAALRDEPSADQKRNHLMELLHTIRRRSRAC